MTAVKPSWIAAALLGIIAVLFLLVRATEKVAPVPVALWVAIQPEGESVARDGAVEIEAGSEFRLHAVLEAETFRGGRLYYTEAKHLALRGEVVPDELLKPWSGRFEARVLWFSVEGTVPFRQVERTEQLSAPRFREIFQPGWGSAWTVTGDLRPASENFLPGEEGVRRTKRFGTQRFQVRIELFDHDDKLVPELRIASWGSDEVPARGKEFPAVIASLPGALEVPTRIFGLPQIELSQGAGSTEVGERMASWTDDVLAFSRISILGSWLGHQGITWEELSWKGVELGSPDTMASPGDLLRVGGRLVWLLEDRGAAGLDEADLCLDFDRGARVQRLGDVFVGEGLVDLARAPGSLR